MDRPDVLKTARHEWSRQPTQPDSRVRYDGKVRSARRCASRAQSTVSGDDGGASLPRHAPTPVRGDTGCAASSNDSHHTTAGHPAGRTGLLDGGPAGRSPTGIDNDVVHYP